MNILSCTNVNMGYDGHIAIKDISFDVEQGDYLCIVGPNGSGKSTLMKGILGLIKPISGTFKLNCMNQKEIGYLPQQTVAQKDFPANVFEVVLSGCINSCGILPFFTKKEKDRANENIDRLGITDLKKKSFRDLSGGQQQRVLLARALCATEKLLLLDEPVNGLDPIITSELYDLIYKLNHDYGITIIKVSHDIIGAVKYGNKILHIEKDIKFFGLKDEYINTDICKLMMGGAILV